MNKKILTVFALILFGAMFVGGRAFAREGWYTIDASTLIGHRVYSPSGEHYLGQISSLAIDPSNDHVALVILSDVPSFGAEHVAIPFGSLGRDFQISFPPNAEKSFTAETLPYHDYNRYYDAMRVGVVPSTIDSAWLARVYKQYEQSPYWTERGEHSQMALYESSSLIGAKVDFAQGGTARVNDLVVDCSNVRITLAILSNVPGWRYEVFAVPFSMLSRKEENAFAVSTTPDRLVSAPIFSRYEDQGSRAYAERVYRYFGIQPYWTE